MTMTMETFMKIADGARVSIAAAPDYSWRGERLDPRLWEALRLELQRRYRRSTGEEFAVLTIEVNPGRALRDAEAEGMME